MNRQRLDDSFNFAAVVVVAVLAVGLSISVSMNYALDRGSVQARADEQNRAVRLAAAASAAEKAARETQVAAARKP